MLTELEPLRLELDRNRKQLELVVDSLSEAEMAQPVREGEYSGRQILAHLAGSERGMTALMRRMAAGEQPRLKPEYDNDFYNARQQDKRAGMSVAQLRAEMVGTRQDLLAFMETLTTADLEKRGDHPAMRDASIREVLEILAGHELDHTLALQSIRKG